MRGARLDVVEVVGVRVADLAELDVVVVLLLAEVRLVDLGRLGQLAVRLQVARLVRVVLENDVRPGVLEVAQADQDDVALTDPDLSAERFGWIERTDAVLVVRARSASFVADSRPFRRTFFRSLPRM